MHQVLVEEGVIFINHAGSMCQIQFPDQGLNLGPLHWEHRVLATGPLEKSFLT